MDVEICLVNYLLNINEESKHRKEKVFKDEN